MRRRVPPKEKYKYHGQFKELNKKKEKVILKMIFLDIEMKNFSKSQKNFENRLDRPGRIRYNTHSDLERRGLPCFRSNKKKSEIFKEVNQ